MVADIGMDDEAGRRVVVVDNSLLAGRVANAAAV